METIGWVVIVVLIIILLSVLVPFLIMYGLVSGIKQGAEAKRENFRSVNVNDIIRTDPAGENSIYRIRGYPETSSLQPMLNPASSESLVRGIIRRDGQGLYTNF